MLQFGHLRNLLLLLLTPSVTFPSAKLKMEQPFYSSDVSQNHCTVHNGHLSYTTTPSPPVWPHVPLSSLTLRSQRKLRKAAGTQGGDASGDTAERPSVWSRHGSDSDLLLPIYSLLSAKKCHSFEQRTLGPPPPSSSLHSQSPCDSLLPFTHLILTVPPWSSNTCAPPHTHTLTLSSLCKEFLLRLRMCFLSWCPFSLLNYSMSFKTVFSSHP